MHGSMYKRKSDKDSAGIFLLESDRPSDGRRHLL